MDVGFVGLGNMGQAMARRLLKAGHTVVAYNRTRRRAAELAPDGARVVATPAEACEHGLVISMLADDTAVEQVVFGPAGILSVSRPGLLHVSMSTISPSLSERLTNAHAQTGQTFVAAPVFGRPEAAAESKLFVVVSGSAPALERCRPLFDAFAQKTVTAGENPPAANLVKLTGNFLIASVIECLGEAMALVRKSGIDPHTYLEILTSTLFTAPIYQIYGSKIAADSFEPVGFGLPLGFKDVRLVLAAAEQAAVPMPVASLIRDRMISALARGFEHQDWSALARISALDAGL